MFKREKYIIFVPRLQPVKLFSNKELISNKKKRKKKRISTATRCWEINWENDDEQRNNRGESMRESWTIKDHGRRSALGSFVRRAGVTNNDAKCTRVKWTWMAGRDEINEPESVKLPSRESCRTTCYAPIFDVPLTNIKSTLPIFLFFLPFPTSTHVASRKRFQFS